MAEDGTDFCGELREEEEKGRGEGDAGARGEVGCRSEARDADLYGARDASD